MALALCAAVNALAEKGRGYKTQGTVSHLAESFSLTLNLLVRWWPEVGAQVLSTQDGCAAAMQAFIVFKVWFG